MVLSQNSQNNLVLHRDWLGISMLKDHGFVQTNLGLIGTNPFQIKVTLPMVFPQGVPFYLHLADQKGQFELLLSENYLVDLLLAEFTTKRYIQCMATVSVLGDLNIDTKTEW